jgi:hypothetical protein
MGARPACKQADASLVVGRPVDDSPVDDSRAVDSPVGEIQVAFLSLVDRACQVDLDLVVLELVARELVVLELVDRACPASEAELADRAYQVGQDSVDFRYLRRARCRDDRVGRALSMVVLAESLRAAAPGETQESFQVEWVVLGVSLVGWFLVAVRRAYTNSA